MNRERSAGFAVWLVAWLLVAGCAQINSAGGSQEALQTQVAHLMQTQSAQATGLAEQAAQLTRLSGFVSYLATVVPRVTPTLSAPTMTPFAPFEGEVLIEGGRCCAGGPVGQPLTLHAELEARSQTGDVVEMRTRVGLSVATIGDMAGQPWRPFVRQVAFDIVPGINWIGYYFSAQFRDSHGVVSEIFWDDISVEGMPPPPTPAP